MAKGKFDDVRSEIIGKVSELLSGMDYEVLTTGSQEICIPIVNAEKDESFLVLTFKVPKGSRDGEAYDGYSVAEDYKLHQQEQAEKKAEAAKKKAEKIARDAAAREAKRKAKEG